MAERIAIMGGGPYAERIERDGDAQRPFKAYRAKRPDGATRRAAVGGGPYARFGNGDGMRRVRNAAGFEDEDAWRARCGTPINRDDGDHHGVWMSDMYRNIR